jgi:hypothetical protein
MNERIKELALICKFDVDQILAEVLCPQDEDLDEIHEKWNQLPKETRSFIHSLLEERQEKFAELIIKRCCDIIETYPIPDYSNRPPPRVRILNEFEMYDFLVKND